MRADLAPAVTVSSLIGPPSEARRVVTTGGWRFTVWEALPDREPRIRDLDAGERLGFARPVGIRDLVKRVFPGEKLNQIHQIRTVARWPGQVAARSVKEFWLTEAQLLKLCARSETEIADAILDDMIRVYILVRRGLLAREQTTLAIPQTTIDGALEAMIAFIAQQNAAGIAPTAGAVMAGLRLRQDMAITRAIDRAMVARRLVDLGGKERQGGARLWVVGPGYPAPPVDDAAPGEAELSEHGRPYGRGRSKKKP